MTSDFEDQRRLRDLVLKCFYERQQGQSLNSGPGVLSVFDVAMALNVEPRDTSAAIAYWISSRCLDQLGTSPIDSLHGYRLYMARINANGIDYVESTILDPRADSQKISDLLSDLLRKRAELRERGSPIDLGTELQAIDLSEARRVWEKALSRLASGDLDGALTPTRSLLESVCKAILEVSGEPYGAAEPLQGLYKKALSIALPAASLSSPGQDHLKTLVRSTLSIVEHVSLYRGKSSDAHGTAKERALSVHQATFAVNLAGATALFLIESFRATVVSERGT